MLITSSTKLATSRIRPLRTVRLNSARVNNRRATAHSATTFLRYRLRRRFLSFLSSLERLASSCLWMLPRNCNIGLGSINLSGAAVPRARSMLLRQLPHSAALGRHTMLVHSAAATANADRTQARASGDAKRIACRAGATTDA